MLYLLPEDQKKKVLREYRTRLIAVSMMFLFVVAVIGVVTLVPSYFLTKIRKDVLEVQMSSMESSLSAINADDLSKKVNDLSDKTSYLVPIADPISPAKLFVHIEDEAAGDTSIRDFHLTYFDENIAVDIKGVSKNRETLTKFIDVLRRDPLFTGLNFPYSSLAKQNNLDFSVHLLYNKSASSSIEYQ